MPMVERRKTRQSSNVFHMLSKNQLIELREAFNLIDRDSDSKLSVEDLTIFLESIGSPYSEVQIKEMILELEPNPTYIVLLTLIGEKLSEIDSEKDLLEAFKIFDEDNDGLIESSFLKKWFIEHGTPITKENYEYLIKGCVYDGLVNYRKLVSKMKHGEIIENQ